MYSVFELPTLYPDPNSPDKENPNYLGQSWAAAINDQSEIAGFSETPQGNTRAVLWRGNSVEDLGTLDPDPNNPGQFRGNSYANAINHNTFVVGNSYHENLSDVRAFRWHKGQMIELKPPDGYTAAMANGINKQEVVVGTLFEPLPEQACIWDPAGKVTVLGIPPSGLKWNWTYSWGLAINDKSEVLVSAGDYSLDYAPYLWSNGNWIALHGPPPFSGAYPEAINNKSEAVGLGFRWDALNGFHELTPPAAPFEPKTYAYAISDNDVIVGMIWGPQSQVAALIWHTGAPTDLNTLVTPNSGWELSRALGVNSGGSIVGIGKTPSGRANAAFVASPQRPLSIDINTVAQVMRILAGIVSDSGGAGLPLGVAIPIPIPPWGPEFEQLPRRLQDATAGRALLQVAGMIREAGLRVRVESIARELLGGRFGMR